MNSHLLIADESVDFGVVEELSKAGFVVFSIMEQLPSVKDVEVLSIANKHDALLLTEDKDFGELVFRLRMSHEGILLIRVLPMLGKEKDLFVTNAIVANLRSDAWFLFSFR